MKKVKPLVQEAGAEPGGMERLFSLQPLRRALRLSGVEGLGFRV